MKIAVLTFFESENYGTVLQAYATQKYLESLGHTVNLLHIKRVVNGASKHYKEIEKKPTLTEKIKYKIVSILRKKDLEKKSKAFEDFRKTQLNVSKYYNSEEELVNELEEYDLFVSGGDQIWNPYHKVFSLNYMFNFLKEDKKRIAYGSSFGVGEISDEEILCEMKECLSKYQAIGVREKSGIDIINKMGIDARQVFDPVFLLNNEWQNMVGKVKEQKKYCLVYALIDYPEEEKKKIQAFARERNLQVLILPYNRQNCLNNFKKKFSLSPEEFLTYIANAEYVFTNSFHGLAFSILFKKEFSLLGCNTKEGCAKRERLIDLLSQLEIEDRKIGEGQTIDYNRVFKTMQKHIESSKQYIDESIKG